MPNKQELVTITGTEISFNNKQLDTATRNIYGYVFGMEKNKFKMAAEMSRILENNLFVDDFDNYETYAGKVFNLKKAMAYNYAAIGKDWIARTEKGNPTGESILQHDTLDYQITKILALMKVGAEQATELANNGTINPFMSVKEIKDIVKNWESKQNAIDVDATETENEQETETESAEQETEQKEQETKNKPFNFVELFSRIANKINEYNNEGNTEKIDSLKWVVEQIEQIAKQQ